MSVSVDVTQSFTCDVHALWKLIGSFYDLKWTGDDPWEFDGIYRTLPEHGMKEQLVYKGETCYTYKMVERPFKNFTVTISAAADGAGSVATYAAVGDLSDEERAMVRDGTRELLAALAATRPSI